MSPLLDNIETIRERGSVPVFAGGKMREKVGNERRPRTR